MKSFFVKIIFIVIGFFLGTATTVFIYPFIFKPAEVNEKISNIKQKTVIAKGTFVDHSPNDPIHWGKGGLKIYKGADVKELYLEPNFQVGPGPAFYVYLSESANIDSNTAFKKAKTAEISPLKSFKGSQVYAIPPNINMKKIKAVVVWCRSFGQLITSSNLNVD